MGPIMRLRGPQEDWQGHGETTSGGLGEGALFEQRLRHDRESADVVAVARYLLPGLLIENMDRRIETTPSAVSPLVLLLARSRSPARASDLRRVIYMKLNVTIPN